MNFRCGAT